MKGKKILILFACVFTAYVFMASPANAQTLEFQVPSVDYPTIQAGIDAAAAEGAGIVYVAAGTYSWATNREVFPIRMKNGVQLIGAGAAVCIINAEFTDTVISCERDSSSRIEGFLITNGGGGSSSGIACLDRSSPIIVNNIITGIRAYVNGWGIICGFDASPFIINNIIVGNSGGFWGGGIYCSRNSSPAIANNIIFRNGGSSGGGIYCVAPSYPVISHNDMYENIPSPYYGCPAGTGDIYVDPELVDYDPVRIDYTENDYHLQSYSFCVDAGTNDFLWLVDFDFDGHLRPLDGDGDELAVVDIGVDEVIPPSVITISATPNVLWPPNHKMVPVTLSVSTSDNCDPAPVCQIVAVSSNEPDNAQGDGNTAPDWEITGDLTLKLRAERSGKGTSRVYTITVRCIDEARNATDQQVIVTVPHDQGNKTQSNNANKGKRPEKIKK